MILPIVKYGHPALRQKGMRIERLTGPMQELIANMFDTMYEAAGIGLAAQQVGHSLQLAILDVRAAKDRPSTLEIAGEAADVAALMPLVLINPQIQPFGDPVAGPEGCLSFPEIFADITRPASVQVQAMNAKGEKIEFKAGGLLSRAIQHENDHLNGILFIDRMSSMDKSELKLDLEAMQMATKATLKKTNTGKDS